MNNIWIDKAARWLTVLLITGLIFSGVYFALALYADGSGYIYQILTLKGFFAWDPARIFPQFINQTPIVLLIKSGVVDLNVLIRTYSFGLVGIPLAFWIAALLEQIRTDLFWGYVIAFCVTYLTCGFYAIGEFNLSYAMVAYSSALLMKEQNLGWIQGVILVLVALALTRSYETMACLGPLLFILSMVRLNKFENNIVNKMALTIAAFFFAAGFGVAIMYILYPRDSGNLHGAKQVGWLIHRFYFFYISFMSLLFFGTWFLKQKRIQVLAIILSFVLALLFLLHPDFWNTPSSYDEYRAFSGLLLFFVISWMAINFLINKTKGFAINIRSTALIPFFLLISLSIPFFLQSLNFFQWLGIYEREVIAHRGVMPLENTQIDIHNYMKDFLWAVPCLSIVLRGDRKGAILVSKEKTWLPFDPSKTADDILISYKKKPL